MSGYNAPTEITTVSASVKFDRAHLDKELRNSSRNRKARLRQIGPIAMWASASIFILFYVCLLAALIVEKYIGRYALSALGVTVTLSICILFTTLYLIFADHKAYEQENGQVWEDLIRSLLRDIKQTISESLLMAAPSEKESSAYYYAFREIFQEIALNGSMEGWTPEKFEWTLREVERRFNTKATSEHWPVRITINDLRALTDYKQSVTV